MTAKATNKKSIVRHYIVTNREIINDEGKEYIREDGREEAREDLRFGYFEFDENNIDKRESDPVLFDDLENDEMRKWVLEDKLPKSKKLGSTKTFEAVYDAMCNDAKKAKAHETAKADTLVFIHGYKNDLDKALKTVRYLHSRYVMKKDSPVKHIVLFTWPSRANYLKYRDDYEDAKRSGHALARGMELLQRFFREFFGKDPMNPEHPPCGANIHFMCQSMGVKVFESMLESLAFDDDKRLTAFIQEVIFIAADVDYDAFEVPYDLNRATELCDRVHSYYHKKDFALRISETTKNAKKRLGKHGIKNYYHIPNDIYGCNVSSVKDDLGSPFQDAINHWYYFTSTEVIDDISKVLKGEVSGFNTRTLSIPDGGIVPMG